MSVIALVVLSLGSFAHAGAGPYYEEAQKVITELRPKPSMKLVDKFLAEAPRITPQTPLEEQAKKLSAYIFGTWKIEPDRGYLSRSQKDNVLPDSVLEKRKGHCLGLTTLYLLLGERLGLSVAFARGPDHVFPRLCDGAFKRCLNIETLKKGSIESDDYFVTNLTIPKVALEKGLYLQTIKSPNELAASFYLGLGFISSQAHQPELAELFYKKATESAPGFAEPYSNLAAVESELGNASQVEPLLSKAISLNPTLYVALLNLGVLAQKKGDNDRARQFYDRALESNPVSAQAYQRRADLYIVLKNTKAAFLDLERILVIQPNDCVALKERNAVAEELGRPARKSEACHIK